MRKLKSFWALLCLLLLSASSAMAAIGTVGSCQWSYDSGTLVISGTGSMGTSTPSYLSSYRTSITKVEIADGVTDICAKAFQNCTNLTSIKIGSGVTKIGDYAFDGCTKFYSYSWGAALKTIGQYAFRNCTSLGSAGMNAVTSIGQYAFSGCTALTSITGSSVTSIGQNAFDGCTKLATVTFSSLVTIGSQAFKGTTSLKSISLPSTLTTINSYAFEGSGLTSFTVPSGLTTVGSAILELCPITTLSSSSSKFTVNGDLLIYNGTTIVATKKAITTLDIPRNVTTIQAYVFDGCTSLKTIIHGWELTTIENYAFKGCTGLKQIHLTNSKLSRTPTSSDTKGVGKDAFSGVTVSNIYFTSDEADVRTYFKSTLGFTKVYDATASNSNLIWYTDGTTLSIEVKQDRSSNYAMTNKSAATDYSWNGLKSQITTVSFPCNNATKMGTGYYVTSIGDYAFQNFSKLTAVSWGYSTKGITSIGDYAFNGCTSLTSFPSCFSAVTSIGVKAFGSCGLNGALSLPSNLKTIKNAAFAVNSNLGAVTIPASVNSIGTNPFYSCPNVSFTSSSSSYVVSNKCLYNSSKTTLVAGVKNGAIYDGATTIAADAFYGLGSTTLTIPSSVTTFNDDCFGNNSFTSIIDNRTSVTSASLTSAKFNDNTKTNCKVQVKNATVKTAYETAGFTKANVMVTSCGDNATWSFDPATGTLNIKGSGAITASGSGKFPWNAVMSQIKILNVQSAITTIPAYAFYNATNLASTNVSVNDQVTSIGEYAFSNTALTSFAFQNTLTSIGNYAFENTKLTSVTIPKSVTSLSAYAFANVQTLASVSVAAGNTYYKSQNNALLSYDGTTLYVLAKNATEIPSSVTTIAANALCHGKTTVTIPASVTTYNSNWAVNASQITKLTVLSTTKPSSFGSLSTSACEVHIGSPVQSTAKTIYNNWSSFSKKVYDYCGTNLTWSVSSNKLTITKVNETGSTGAMWNFTSGATATTLPWYSSKGTITSVAIGSGVTTVGDYAFQNCGAITSVTIPNTVTMIGAGAFSGATKLASVTLPSALTSIGENAFQSTAIKSLSIPATVTVIGAFGANSIQTIKVDPANTKFTSQDKSGNELNMLLTKDGTSLFLCPATTENVTLPSTLTEVKAGAFNGAVGKLTIPSTVTTMSSWPTSAYSIHAANEPTTAATVPSSLKSVKVYASSAAVKTKYTSLGFTNIVTGTSCGDKASYILENGVLTIMGTGSTNSAPWLTNDAAKIRRVVIESGINAIEEESFKDCANLTYVSFPEGFTTIGESSFSGCTNLKTVQLPSTLNNVLGAFVGSSVENVSVVPGGAYTSQDKNGNELNALIWKGELEFGLTSNIPNTVTKIKYNAFSTSTIKEVSIPSSVTGIDVNAFLGNTTLASIYCSSTAAVTNAFDPAIKSKAKVYVATAAIKTNFVNAGFKEANVIVADGTIGADVYYCVAGTKLIVFGSGATLNYSGFAQFKSGTTDKTASIKSIVIAEGVTSLGNNVFKGCTALAGKVVVPMSVTSIGSGTFGGATKIASVVSDNVKPAAMNPAAFTNDVYANAALIVSDASRVKYLNAAGWENFGGVQTNEEVANPYDLNKDGYVNASDMSVLKKFVK
ncbi:MAG: leucine-rich repeat protein [Paludibacteraceae bacterium]|nr:leucine-rich repeat protein [Paludibacteraceae bacterium]